MILKYNSVKQNYSKTAELQWYLNGFPSNSFKTVWQSVKLSDFQNSKTPELQYLNGFTLCFQNRVAISKTIWLKEHLFRRGITPSIMNSELS